MSAYTKQKFSNGKLALETEFKCDSTSHITHNHFILSNEHFFVSDNNKFPRTSQFIHQTKWIDFSSNDFIHPEHYGSADLFLDAYQDNRIYKDDLSFLVKSLFDVCLAPSLDKLLTVTNLDSIDYSGLLVGKFGLNIDLGVDYLIKTSKVDEADNDCVLFRKLFSIINQFENKIDHNKLIDAFDKRNINLLNLYSTHSNETEKDQFKHNSFFETMMARYTENILNDIINESVLDSASQNANQDKTNSFDLSL
ncbi:hypothetical protein OCF84_21100 (plasmid) [Shewanella xiamenensis]|nr:hypothetical protein [Shewanella xiamenensis]WHF57756.1 hypothetical protein OCF84_21100 [Shewanella xiamenensis]